MGDQPSARILILAEADAAYFTLIEQVTALLDVATAYCEATSLKDVHSKKVQWVQATFTPIASLITQLSEVIRRWKHEEPRVLSQIGVELEILNELWVHLESLMILFLRDEYPLRPFSPKSAEIAVKVLRRTNRMIP